MIPYAYWSRARHPREPMCVACGAIRPTLHLPEFRCDAVTRTFLPMLAHSFALHAEQMAARAAA